MDLPANDPDAAHTAALAEELRAALSKLIRRLREESRLEDLTWSQKSALLRLEREGPLTVTALARAEGVRPQSMGATVAGLEQLGAVSSAPDPADRRQTLWSLTPACRERVRANRAARTDWLFRAIRAQLTPAETAQLAAAVELLGRIGDT